MCTFISEVRTYLACVYVLCMNMRCLLPEISRQVAASVSILFKHTVSSIQSQPVAACVSILCFEYGSTPNWKTFRLDRIPKRITKEASGGTGLL